MGDVQRNAELTTDYLQVTVSYFKENNGMGEHSVAILGVSAHFSHKGILGHHVAGPVLHRHGHPLSSVLVQVAVKGAICEPHWL